jgi:hypothetical protein
MYGILVLAVCTADLLFTYVNAGSPGSVGDAAVWNNTKYKTQLCKGVFDAAESTVLPGDIPLHAYVVGDSAFALGARLMKCYDDAQTSDQEALNGAIIRTRRVIENAFGRLKMRWNVCTFNRIKDAAEARDIALICCALHNFCEKRCQAMDPHWASHISAEDAQAYERARQRRRNRSTTNVVAGTAVRDALAEYVRQRWAAQRYM